MPETWAWISGWAIQPDRFRAALEHALPAHRHVVFEPNAHALDSALATEPARLGGYSLGSLLLLAGIDRIPAETKLYCLAPFLAFCAEAGMGGTTPEASLAAIRARLLLSPEKALKLFYRLAGLRDEPTGILPYALEDLDWGLAALQTCRAAPEACSRVFAVQGMSDPLVEKSGLSLPWGKIVRFDASHHYKTLVKIIGNDTDS